MRKINAVTITFATSSVPNVGERCDCVPQNYEVLLAGCSGYAHETCHTVSPPFQCINMPLEGVEAPTSGMRYA